MAAITAYEQLTTTNAKILCGAFRAGAIDISTLDTAKAVGKITTAEYSFIKG